MSNNIFQSPHKPLEDLMSLETRTYQSFEAIPVAPVLGEELVGVDLGGPRSDQPFCRSLSWPRIF